MDLQVLLRDERVDQVALQAVFSLTSQQVRKGGIKRPSLRKNKEWHSGSSSSSGGEDRRPRDQEEELKKLRAQVELLSKQQSGWKGQATQGVPTRRGSGLEEDCKVNEG